MHLNVKEYDVDDVLVEVGQWGRYQQKLFLYMNCQHVLLGIILFSILFIGVEPSWKCGAEPLAGQDSRRLHDKCVTYEKQSCVVEVDQPYLSIVAEVSNKQLAAASLAPPVPSVCYDQRGRRARLLKLQ